MLPDFRLRGRAGNSPDIIGTKKRVHILGRGPAADVQLLDPTVSELHAALVRDTNGVWIIDLGSRNLLRVGEHVTRRQKLADGNKVEIGPFSWRVSISGKPESASAGPRNASLLERRSGRRIELTDIITTIGRRENSRIRLNDDAVSRTHALLVRTADGLLMRNLSRRTGTSVNNQRLDETLLQQGDVLQVGKAVFEVDLSTRVSVSKSDSGRGRPADLAHEIESALEGGEPPTREQQQRDEIDLPDDLFSPHPPSGQPPDDLPGLGDEEFDLPSPPAAGQPEPAENEPQTSPDDAEKHADDDVQQHPDDPEQSLGLASGPVVGQKTPGNPQLNDWLDQLYYDENEDKDDSKQADDGGRDDR